MEYEDFLETVSDYRLKTEQASKITQIGKALAYAEEFTCWPPKLFIILGKINTFLFINNNKKNCAQKLICFADQ